jgi:hypothetical protein
LKAYDLSFASKVQKLHDYWGNRCFCLKSRGTLRAMWDSIKSYFKFCGHAVREQLRQSRWLKSIKTAYKVIAFISTLILLWWSLREIVEALPPLGKRWWAIIILSFVIACLLTLIGVIKSFHERTVREVNELHERTVAEASAGYKSRARIIEKLSYVNGLAEEIDKRYWINKESPKPSKEELEIWCGFLTTALHDSYGTSGINIFTYDNPEAIKVPDDPYLWFRMTRDRLSKLITEQLQAQLITRKETKQLKP